MSSEADAIISKAIDVLHERGWAQGVEEDDDGSVCVTGALRYAALGHGWPTPWYEALVRISKAAGLEGIDLLETWNDRMVESVEDVFLVLKRALAGETA